MAIYHIAKQTTVTTTAAACMEIRTSATDRVRVLEIGVFLGAATASRYGLGRPQAIGVTPTSPVTVLAGDPADAAGTTTVAVAWGTAPTVPLNFFRRAVFPASIGAGVIWTFPSGGLTIAVSSSLVLWNLAVNSADTEVYWVTDE